MSSPRGRVMAVLFALAAVLRLSATALGAGPVYQPLRYEDDFSYLADPARRSDPWDGLKYIPISASRYGPVWLSLGGELRERFEAYHNPNFGLRAPPANAYSLHRLQLHMDLHLTDYIRVFAQVANLERVGARGIASTTDINHLELSQGFIDFRPPSPLGDAPVLRVGREELLFGSQRLIAVREGPNVRRAFDGFRFTDQWRGISLDLFAARPVANSPEVFNDHANLNQMLWGAYLTVPVGEVLKADLYWLNYENKTARFRGLTGIETRQTYGVRLFGETGGFDWNAEFAAQTGSFRDRKIRAAMGAMAAGYTFENIAWKPRMGVEANAASGDNGRAAEIGTFNAMFPRLPYFAVTSLLVPANVIDVRPVVTVRPLADISVTLGWDMLWRASNTDGLYGSGLVQYPSTNGGTGNHIGTELSADVRWRVDPHLTISAIAARFLAGPAVRQAFGKSVTFLVLSATYRF